MLYVFFKTLLFDFGVVGLIVEGRFVGVFFAVSLTHVLNVVFFRTYLRRSDILGNRPVFIVLIGLINRIRRIFFHGETFSAGSNFKRVLKTVLFALRRVLKILALKSAVFCHVKIHLLRGTH